MVGSLEVAEVLLVPLLDKAVVAVVVPESEAVPVVAESVDVYVRSTDFVVKITEVSTTDAVEEVTTSELVDVPEVGAEVPVVPSVLVISVSVDVFPMFVLVPSTSLRVVDVESVTVGDVSPVFVTESEVVTEIAPVKVGSVDAEVDVDVVPTSVAAVSMDELDLSVTASLLLVVADISAGPVLVDKVGDVDVPSTLRLETESELDVVAAEVFSVDVAIPEAVPVVTSETDDISEDLVVSKVDPEARDVAA